MNKEKKRVNCEDYIVLYDRTVTCSMVKDHLTDHIAMIEDDYYGIPVRVTWPRKDRHLELVKEI